MDKKLTPLEALKRIKEFYPAWRLSNREDFNIIETALQEGEKCKILYEQVRKELLK